MKKLIYFTDSHYTNKRPRARKDDYRASIKSKLIQIDEIAKKENVDMILSGGDITHVHNEDYEIFMDLFEYHSNAFRKHHVIAGLTHDFKSEFSTGIQKSTLGALWKTGVVIVHPQTLDFELEGIKIHSSHQTICPTPFFGHHTLYKDFKTDAKIVLISHMHMPFGIQEVNGITFVSPGSLARNSGDQYNFNRIPQVALICIDNDKIDKIEFIPLEVEQNVWDHHYLIHRNDKDELQQISSLDSLESFMEQDEGILDASGIIQKLGERYNKEAVECALEFKGRADND